MQKTILVTRFSALGDVAMTIPVMRQVLADNPDVQIVFVSNKNWAALCEGIPRLTFFPADVKGIHKGVGGLYKLFTAIRKAHKIAAVADLHNVLRSKIVRTFFWLAGIPVAAIDKGRAGKKALTRKADKLLHPLKTTLERYASVFTALGLPCNLYPAKQVFPPQRLNSEITAVIGAKNGETWIGVAPFATYREKTYPLAQMAKVLAALAAGEQQKVLLFGGGAGEIAQLTRLADEYPGMVVVAGRFSLREELAIISQLDVMISMDSANMHLASLFGIPVISVWGATHPFAGFMGYGQSMENAVQITDLACRPCSVFGNKPCYRGDHACMEWLEPARLLEKTAKYIRS